MQKTITLLIALLVLSVAGAPAFAMTELKAEQLVKAASSGNIAALTRLETAAKAGDPHAQEGLGDYLYVHKNYAKAAYWWRKAAAQGSVNAETQLGFVYSSGRMFGVPWNYAKAVYWERKAAAQGSITDETQLGLAYSNGRGVPINYAKAAYWWGKAAAQGDYAGGAETSLGDAYFHGLGVPRNYAKAVYWYRKAAAQRDAEAETNLGSAYFHGQGVPQDSLKAIYWWKKAAQDGIMIGVKAKAQALIDQAEHGG